MHVRAHTYTHTNTLAHTLYANTLVLICQQVLLLRLHENVALHNVARKFQRSDAEKHQLLQQKTTTVGCTQWWF